MTILLTLKLRNLNFLICEVKIIIVSSLSAVLVIVKIQ